MRRAFFPSGCTEFFVACCRVPVLTGCVLSLSPSRRSWLRARWHLQKFLVGICMIFRFASILPFEIRSILHAESHAGHLPSCTERSTTAPECFTAPCARYLKRARRIGRGTRGDGMSTGRTSITWIHLGNAMCLLVVALEAVAQTYMR